MYLYEEKKARLLAYTRKVSDKDCPEGLAYSIHLAWSKNGEDFRALHQNYGILFAEGEISGEDTIVPKGVKNPKIFRFLDGSYGILADRTEENGCPERDSRGVDRKSEAEDIRTAGGMEKDAESPIAVGRLVREAEVARGHKAAEGTWAGYALLWKTEDFREFGRSILIEKKGIEWEALQTAAGMSAQGQYLVEGEQVTGCCLEIGSAFCDRIVQKWTQIHNVEIRLPGIVQASSPEDMAAVGAQAVYSDGSTAFKKVAWNTEPLDFTKPGLYEVTGKVCSRKFPFPLAKGYGDPVIFDWQGKWYFLGTNDNLGDIGIYVREADSVEALFAENAEEHLILGVDEEKGFIQTFWAPEFHIIGGRLYILFAVGGKVWGPQCHMMRLKEGGKIVRPEDWEAPVKVLRRDGTPLTGDGITLDMTYLKTGSGSYLVWSYRRGIGTPKDTGSMLYIARTKEEAPWRLSSEPVLLSRPLYGWENVSGTINNEGPHGFVKNGKVYLTYSGGDAAGYTYALGLLTADGEEDLTDPAVWKKSGVPVLSFRSVEGEYGPGHNSFYINEDGNLMIAYHGETSLESRLRCDGIRRVHFDIQGEPVFDLSAERDLNPALEMVKLRVAVTGK